MNQLKFFTIGVYGFTEAAFFSALINAKVDTFCDIRLRRGMRGNIYSFANSKYLQNRLLQLGIKYIHFKELAPSKETRYTQKLVDKKLGYKKRNRMILSQDFIQAYRQQCLEKFKTNNFLEKLGGNANCIVLFCVEKEPSACHRSLIALEIERELNQNVIHILP
jgi:uncharacterized protein (DUF488 family)